MSDEEYRETEWTDDSSQLALERDARRYDKAFTEEQEVRLR